MKHLLIILSLSLLGLSCGTTKVASPGESTDRKLKFSHGGGFTGKYNTYWLLENGQLFKNTETEGIHQEMKALSHDIASQIFAGYTTLDLANVEVKTYGNLLYSITMTENGKDHLVRWEKNDAGSDNLQLYYRSVMNQIKIHSEGQKPSNPSKIKATF